MKPQPNAQTEAGSPPRRFALVGGEPEKALANLRHELSANFQTVRAQFAKWDDSDDGVISRQEWIRALPEMGLVGEQLVGAAAALFDDLDTDKSGSLNYRELHVALRQGASIELEPKLKPGAVAYDVPARRQSPQEARSRSRSPPADSRPEVTAKPKAKHAAQGSSKQRAAEPLKCRAAGSSGAKASQARQPAGGRGRGAQKRGVRP